MSAAYSPRRTGSRNQRWRRPSAMRPASGFGSHGRRDRGRVWPATDSGLHPGVAGTPRAVQGFRRWPERAWLLPSKQISEPKGEASWLSELQSTASGAQAARRSALRTSARPTSNGWRSTISPIRRCSPSCSGTTRSTARFAGTVEAADGAIIVDGIRIAVAGRDRPAKLPWADLDVDVVIESTGRFRVARGRGQAPRGRRAQGDHLGPGEGPGRHGRARRQLRRGLRPGGAPDHLERVLHDELPRARWRRCCTRRSGSATA